MAAKDYQVRYEVRAFDGGLNNKYQPGIIDDIDSPDCLNVVFDERGACGTREGYTQVNTAAVGSFIGDGLFTARFNDGSETMLAWWNGSMYDLQSTSFVTVGSAQSVFTAGQKVYSDTYQNLIFFGNGGSTPYKYNGTEFTRHGIPAATATVSAVSNDTGVVTGTVFYKVTYVNSYLVEGDVSSNTASLSVGSATVRLTDLPTAPQSHGVNQRYIYRSSTVSGTYLRVGTISDNTTTTFDDDVSDDDLGVAAPTDQGEPPDWKYIIKHKERLFLVDPDNPMYLWYTPIGNPFKVEAEDFLKIGDGDGERITGLAVHADGIVVGKENSVWFVFMPDTTPGNWQIIKTNSAHGMASHKAAQSVDGRLLFLGKQYAKPTGWFALAGVRVEDDRTDLDAGSINAKSKSDKIEPDVFTFAQSDLEKSASILYDNKAWFSVPGSGETENSKVYQYDFQRRDKDRRQGSWVPFDGIYAADFTIFGGKLYFQDSQAVGLVHQLENGTFSDNGSAIDSYAWFKEFHGHKQDKKFHKDFRYLEFLLSTLGNYNINITFKTDSDKGSGNTKVVNTNPGGGLWGTMTWGVDSWGGGLDRQYYKIYLSGARGRRLQFKIDNNNTVNQGFKIHPESGFVYNRRGLR